MPNAAECSRERRWIIIGADGRFVTLGRDSDPSEREILAAEEMLQAQGLSGWLAVMEGNPYVGAVPKLIEVRPLACPGLPFSEAAEACVWRILRDRSSLA
jgi:hypothetical protein